MRPLPARGEVWWVEPPEIGKRPMVVYDKKSADSAKAG